MNNTIHPSDQSADKNPVSNGEKKEKCEREQLKAGRRPRGGVGGWVGPQSAFSNRKICPIIAGRIVGYKRTFRLFSFRKNMYSTPFTSAHSPRL